MLPISHQTPTQNTALSTAADFPVARAKEDLMVSPKVRRAVAGVLAAAETFKAVSDGCLAEFEGKRDGERDRRKKLDLVINLCLNSSDWTMRKYGNLIEKSGNVDAPWKLQSSLTALITLCASVNDLKSDEIRKILEALLNAGANTEAKHTNNGNTPFVLAFQREDYETVVTLIHHGAIIKTKDHNGKNIIISEIQEKLARKPDKIAALLDAGMNPNDLNTSDGNFNSGAVRNVFMYAVYRGYVETVKILLEHRDFDVTIYSQGEIAYERASAEIITMAGLRRPIQDYLKIQTLIAAKMAKERLPFLK